MSFYAAEALSSLNRRYKHYRWQVFGITWLAYAGFYFTRKAFSVAKIGMLADPSVNISEQTMGNIDALYLLAYAVGQFAFGIMADKIGTRRVVLAGLFVSAIATAAMGFSTVVVVLGLLMFIQGLCQASGWAPLSKNLGYWFSRQERGRVFGFWCTNYAVGSMAASPFAGFAAMHLFHDWRWALFAPAIVVLIVWFLFLVFQKNKPADVGLPSIESYKGEAEDIIESGDSPGDEPDGSWKVVREVYRNPVILLLGFVYFLQKPARYTLLLWGPVIVSQRLGTNMFDSSVIAVTFDAAGIFGAIAAGYISDKMFGSRRMPVCIISLTLLSVVFAGFAFFDSVMTSGGMWIMIGIFMFSGFLHYGPDSIIGGSAAVDFGSKKGASSAAGFVNGCGSFGAILGGWLPGHFDDKGVLFYWYAGAIMLSVIIMLPLWNRLPPTSTVK